MEKPTDFGTFLQKWGEENTNSNGDEGERGKRRRGSDTFTCDYCEQKGFGVPTSLPDPSEPGSINYVGPQGRFCSYSCAKACAQYELQRSDISSLIDQMAGITVTPAVPWTQLEVVKQDGTGKTREDWTQIQDDTIFEGDQLIDDRMLTGISKTKKLHREEEK